MANPKPLLLDGLVDEPPSDDTADTRRESQGLKDEVRALRHEVEDLTADKQRLERSIQNLRSTLNPMYRALRALFGEIELAVGADAEVSAGAAPAHASTDPRWEHFKKQFPGVPALIVEALLIHGTVKLTNLAGLLGKHYDTIKAAAWKLRKAGACELTSEGLSLKR